MPVSQPFEAYRTNSPGRIGLLRLIGGLAVILIGWIAVVVAVVLPLLFWAGADPDFFTSSSAGSLAMLATFAGIWIGAWLAMRYVLREPLKNLFGATRRLNWPGFWKGFTAVAATSVLSEILIYAVQPEFTRTEISIDYWLLFLIPVAALGLVQTSSEELLFRGYLMRGLANRFRSPWIWAVLPGLTFVAMHYSPSMSIGDILLLVFTIGALTVALVFVVWRTGNLGAAFGMHFGNNLFSFLLVAHQRELSSFALFRGAPVDDLGANSVFTVSAIAILCVGLTLFLLLHHRSPLLLEVDDAEDLVRTFD